MNKNPCPRLFFFFFIVRIVISEYADFSTLVVACFFFNLIFLPNFRYILHFVSLD